MNPLQLIQTARNGGNPQALAMQYLQNQAKTNPEAAKMYSMLQGKSPEEFSKIAQNLVSSRGGSAKQSFDSLKSQFGL